MAAVRFPILLFVENLRPERPIVRLTIVSLVSVHVMNNGISKSDAIMDQLRRLQRVCAHFCVHVRASHQPSAVNHVADKL